MPVYLDHAATTPLRPEARDAWLAAYEQVGNPASIHAHGQRVRAALEAARERIAHHLGAQAVEVVLTSGGTESINLAIKGLWWARNCGANKPRILTTRAEHHATLDTVEWLTRYGAQVEFIPVDACGCIRLDVLAQRLDARAQEVALISVLHANNEVGTVQPVAQIGQLGQQYGVPVHVDAVASLGHEYVALRAWGVSAVSVSAHKVGGPVGVGALAVARDAQLEALLHGGGQQRGLRSGTQDVAGAAAFAAALDAACDATERERLRQLRDALIRGVRQRVPEAVLRGTSPQEPGARLVNNAHFTFPGAQGDSLLFLLDMVQISASTGSACQAGIPEPSHVLQAMGEDEATARGALRFTLGWNSTEADVAALMDALPEAYATARKAGFSNRAR